MVCEFCQEHEVGQTPLTVNLVDQHTLERRTVDVPQCIRCSRTHRRVKLWFQGFPAKIGAFAYWGGTLLLAFLLLDFLSVRVPFLQRESGFGVGLIAAGALWFYGLVPLTESALMSFYEKLAYESKFTFAKTDRESKLLTVIRKMVADLGVADSFSLGSQPLDSTESALITFGQGDFLLKRKWFWVRRLHPLG